MRNTITPRDAAMPPIRHDHNTTLSAVYRRDPSRYVPMTIANQTMTANSMPQATT